jgi:DNA-binding transcriptional regulator YhcF (GntR family)
MQFKDNETIFSQIEEYVRRKIFEGAFKAGERLPAIREFALLMKVNPNTIVKVYDNLEREGLIYSERTNGKFVIEDIEILTKKKKDYIAGKVGDFVKNIKEITENEEELIKLIREKYGEL